MPDYLRIKPASSSHPGFAPTPDEIETGELALNTADAVLYTKLADGTIAPVCCGGQQGAATSDADFGRFTGGNAGYLTATATVSCDGASGTVWWAYSTDDCSVPISGFEVYQRQTAGDAILATVSSSARSATFQASSADASPVLVRTVAAAGVPVTTATASQVAAECCQPHLYTVSVDSQSDWYSPGVQVAAGDYIEFSASGRVKWRLPAPDDTGPEGLTFSTANVDSNFHHEAIIGRVNAGPAFLVGARRSITVTESGSLSFCTNDTNRADNEGAFTLRFTVYRCRYSCSGSPAACTASPDATMSWGQCTSTVGFLNEDDGQYYRYATYRDNDRCTVAADGRAPSGSDGHYTLAKRCDGTVMVLEATGIFATTPPAGDALSPARRWRGTYHWDSEGSCMCGSAAYSGWFFHNTRVSVSDEQCTPFPPDAP